MRIFEFRSLIGNAALAALLLIELAIPQALEAQTLQRSDNPLCDWELRGQIETGLTERFEKKSIDWPPQTLLCLDSPGGHMLEGAALFDSLFAADVITVIPPGWQCESACAIAFLAGGVSAGSLVIHWPQRVLYPGGHLGFHAPSLNLPDTGTYTAQQVTQAFSIAVAGADRIVQLNQMIWQGETPMNGFLLRRTLGTPPEEMAHIDTIAEAAMAEITISGVQGPSQFDEKAAENACDLAIALHRGLYRRIDVDGEALLMGLSKLREGRQQAEHSEIRIGARKEAGDEAAYALVTHYHTDIARHMLACEISLQAGPEALPNTRHSLNDTRERLAEVRLLSHRWGIPYGVDDLFEPEEIASYSLPVWFLHSPETPLSIFAPPPEAPVLLPAIDLPGNDLTSRGIRDVSLEGCAQACRETPECQAFSYVEDRQWCWPKSRTAQPSFDNGIISGIMPASRWMRD